MITGILGYNSQNDRYGILVMDLWEVEGLHCGDCLEVWNSDTEQWISTRIEIHYHAPSFPKSKNNEWYLVGTPYSGTALDGLKARVN